MECVVVRCFHHCRLGGPLPPLLPDELFLLDDRFDFLLFFVGIAAGFLSSSLEELSPGSSGGLVLEVFAVCNFAASSFSLAVLLKSPLNEASFSASNS